jgi:hypothetical protein
MVNPIPGKYKHYKGNFYEVLDIVLHSESLEELVLYKPLYESNNEFNGKLWVRPVAMFMEKVEIDGKVMPRFKQVI